MARILLALLFSCNLLAMESVEITQETLNATALNEFHKIVGSYWKQLTSNNISVLNSGYWYANDYFTALERHNQGQRKEWLKQRDAFVNGFAQPRTGLMIKAAPFEYYLKAERQPSKVLNQLETSGFFFIDCSMAYQIAYYRAIITLWGHEKFDGLFGSPSMRKKPFLSTKTGNTMLGGFVDMTLAEVAGEPGTHFVISNHPLYTFKDKSGEAQAYNLLVLEKTSDEVRFIGFGLNPDGVTADAIAEQLLINFNQSPFNERIASETTWARIEPESGDAVLLEALKDMKVNSLNDMDIIDDLYNWFIKKYGAFNAKGMKDYVSEQWQMKKEEEKLRLSVNLSLRKLLDSLGDAKL